MLERLGRDTLLYGLSTLLVRGIQIVLIPVYSRILGAAEYGIVETIAIVGALVNLTVALEISQGMARYLADTPDQVARRAYASTALVFSVLAYGLFVSLSAIAGQFFSPWLLGDRASMQVLLVAFGALAINGIFVLVQDLLRWVLRPGVYLAAGLAYALGSAGTGILLVMFMDTGVIGVFWGQFIGALLGGIVSAQGARDLLAAKFDLPRLRQMLRYSLPLAVSGVAVFGSLYMDRIVVREALGLDSLGIYGVAARFASVVSVLTVGLQAALSPLVFRSWREPGTAHALARTCRFYCACMVPLVGGLALFSGEIMLVATGPAFHDGRAVLPILALAAMFSTLYIFAPGLFLGERTWHVAALNTGGALLNFALASWLVPQYGMVAAALTTAVTTAAAFAGFAYLGQAHFRIPYRIGYAAVSVVISVGLVSLALAWNTAPPALDAGVVAVKAIVLLIAAAAAIVGGLSGADRAFAADAIRSLARKLQKGKQEHGH